MTKKQSVLKGESGPELVDPPKGSKIASAKTRTVYHPTLNASREVPAAKVEDWRAMGWRLTKPEPKTPAAAADQGQHSDEGDH
jgi:hypothetical protein